MPIKQLRNFERISLNKKDEKIIEFEFIPIKDLTILQLNKTKIYG